MASASGSNSKVVTMKLLIDKNAERVLFAEASKDTVDFLFTILSLPVSTVASLLNNQQMVGSLGNLSESLEHLGEEYILPNQHKNNLLKPNTGEYPMYMPDLYYNSTATSTAKKFYVCNNNYRDYGYGSSCGFMSDKRGTLCPGCKFPLYIAMNYVDGGSDSGGFGPGGSVAEGGGGGFVKGAVMYMVTDDLVVKPMSTISSITLLNKFNVQDVFALEEKIVHLDMSKGLKLLKESMISKNVLTSVFL